MIQKLANLLHHAARSLESAASPAPPDVISEKPAEQSAEDAQTVPAPSQVVSAPPPRLWRRIFNDERAHLHWLWDHPQVIGIALGLAIAIVVAEKWAIQAWQGLVSQARLYWPNIATHPVALIGVGAILIYLIFGLHWLRHFDDLVHWILGGIKKRPRLSTLVAGILLLIGLWLASNHGTWVVLPFTVGQTETVSLDGQKVAVQLIAELNQVGVGNPTPALNLWKLLEPRTSSGSVTARRNLPFEECDTVLQGPGDFIPYVHIPLTTRVLAGSQGTPLNLGNLSIGTINIPSQIFTQFILRILPTGYREFNGQITEHKGVLEISVASRNPPHAWRVSGPSDALPDMMEYLALRMALDLNPDLIKSSGLNTPPSDRDLAFAIGNQAFRWQHYQQAWAFYELADRFSALDEKVNAMQGLTRYHLALEEAGEAAPRLDAALKAMEAAVREDPNGDSSLLRPYLICLYHKAGQEQRAKAHHTIFTQYLRRLEFRDFDVRVDAIKQLPLRGPGRHLSAAGSDVIFLNEAGAIVGAAGRPLNASLSLPDQNPRQVGLYGDSGLLFISSDGAVLAYDYQAAEETQIPSPLIEGRALSGVQQVVTSTGQFRRTNLFLLNRFGKVYWCEPDAEAGSTNACPPRRPMVSEPSDARQIFPVEDQLYILAADGAVWHTRVNVSGQALVSRQITPPAQVQEIFLAEDGTLYLLHDNGNVRRYYDDGRPETEDLKLIDPGTGTAQIFAAGDFLYLLKSDGAVWRISNPRNPAPGDFNEISTPPEGMTFQEMFVTAESPAGEVVSGHSMIYLLTDQRVLWQGADTGDARLVLTPVSMPAPIQTAATP